jgi:hypothetical protein
MTDIMPTFSRRQSTRPELQFAQRQRAIHDMVAAGLVSGSVGSGRRPGRSCLFSRMTVLPASIVRAITCLALLLALFAVGGCSSQLAISSSTDGDRRTDATPALAGTISVPWIKQKTATECGRAALASLAARHGGNIEAFYQELPAPPDPVRGYSVPEMQRFGARVGVELTVHAPAGIVITGECSPRPAVTAHFARLADFIAAGRPVVVPVARGFGAGHYLVLVGAESGSFTALDPASPSLRRIGTSELAGYMCGFGYVALVSR